MSRKYSLLAVGSLALLSWLAPTALAKGKMEVWYGGQIVDAEAPPDGKPGDGLLIPCHWVCENGSTGYCEPPTLELCIAEANHACDVQSDQ